MFLREYLTKYTKEELLDQARSFEIKKCSGLRKADLIDRIVDTFCAEEMLRSRLACLTKEQMDLFRKACISPTAVSVNEVVDAMQLYRYWIGYFEDPTDRFCVFEDVAVAFSKIDDKAFQLKQCRKGWLVKCIHFFIQYYGIAPIEVIYGSFCMNYSYMEEIGEERWDLIEDFYKFFATLKGYSEESAMAAAFEFIEIFSYFKKYDRAYEYMVAMAKENNIWVYINEATFKWACEHTNGWKVINAMEDNLKNNKIDYSSQKNYKEKIDKLKKIRGF